MKAPIDGDDCRIWGTTSREIYIPGAYAVCRRSPLAGIVGFEPTNMGVKVPCLRPLGDIPSIVAVLRV